MNRMWTKRKVLPAVVGALLLGGIGVGVATATTPSAPPALSGNPAVTADKFDGNPGFEKNAAGQTYGVPVVANGQSAEPELIRAVATNGQVGYIKNSERKIATGDPSLFKSPAEALKWQESRGSGAVTVPVYDVEGVTKIGQFVFTSNGAVEGPVK
ncbi:hypothetical protein [Pseudarthrobacter sp. DSP2-3-2b1]|uniref:hypothetical protein n=1 Tax=Pseudarthrobacter sp. DSP2-3-2b1 TaxID=2804661 RepID=UPI003CFA5EFF